MKNLKIIGAICAFVIAASFLVHAATVTQTAAAVAKNLPPSTRTEKMNNGIADVTTTDLPAIIAELNRLSTGGVAKVEAGATFNLVVVTNVTKQTVSLTDTNGVTALAVTNITPQTFTIKFVSGVATNSP
jgi:hypothetical protein